MRGNELIQCGGYNGQQAKLFQIPMRGNESLSRVNVIRFTVWFQIPMRGNEQSMR